MFRSCIAEQAEPPDVSMHHTIPHSWNECCVTVSSGTNVFWLDSRAERALRLLPLQHVPEWPPQSKVLLKFLKVLSKPCAIVLSCTIIHDTAAFVIMRTECSGRRYATTRITFPQKKNYWIFLKHSTVLQVGFYHTVSLDFHTCVQRIF